MLIVLFVLELTITSRVDTSELEVLNPVEKTMMIYLASIYISTCVGFIIYGGLIVWRISNISPILVGGSKISPIRRRLLYRIVAITSVVSLSFIVRGVLSILSLWVHFSASSWWFDPVYFVVLEVFPLLMMIWLLHRGKTKRSRSHHSIQDSATVAPSQSSDEGSDRHNVYRETDIIYVGDDGHLQYGSEDRSLTSNH